MPLDPPVNPAPSGPAPLEGALPSSGHQYRLRHGDHVATVVQVGAAVREYRVGTREVFQTCPGDDLAWGFHGAVLVPWPNRVAGGAYRFDGAEHQLAVSEPALGNALHGLAAWLPWRLVEHAIDRVTLATRLFPSPGYPFQIETVVEYRLDDDGLHVRATTTNLGDQACPFAIGFHPYLSPGAGATLDDCQLHLDAGGHLRLDDRLVPAGDEAVDGGVFDFRAEASLSGRVLDDAFFDVLPDAAGRSWAKLTGPDGRTVAIWADESFGYWQVFSGETLTADLARRGLAAEPMTAAPDAFNSGRGLRRLEPGEAVAVTWGARLL